MLEDNRNVVEALRDALLDREELIGDEILTVIRGSQPSGRWPPARPAAVSRAPEADAGTVRKVDRDPPQLRSAQLLQRPRKTTSTRVDGHPVTLGPWQGQAPTPSGSTS